jgi:hypothetical protein
MEHPRFKLQGHEQEVAELYLGGKSSTQIGKKFGCAYASVLQCLRKQGVSVRPARMVLLSHCKRGHEMAGVNLYITPKGIRGCRACRAIHSNESPSAKEYRKFWQIKKLYGLTREQYEEKLKSQNRRCAICNREMVKPHLDHDHDSQQLRDALCNNCNAAVGYVEENITTAENLVAYLKKWKSDA